MQLRVYNEAKENRIKLKKICLEVRKESNIIVKIKKKKLEKRNFFSIET